MLRAITAASLLVLALALSGCAGSSAEEPGDAGDAIGMCAPGVTDCVDTVVSEQPFDAETARTDAQALLGKSEAEVTELGFVRVGRRGDEHMALTEDYVLGRMTVELDSDADGTFRVVSVTVELPDGPETFGS